MGIAVVRGRGDCGVSIRKAVLTNVNKRFRLLRSEILRSGLAEPRDTSKFAPDCRRGTDVVNGCVRVTDPQQLALAWGDTEFRT